MERRPIAATVKTPAQNFTGDVYLTLVFNGDGMEHPGFGGDSILPRCSCLGGPLSSTVPPPGGTTV